MAGKIFLNYRRGDDPGTVGRLFDRLEQAFTKEQIFMDVEGHIKAGDDYVDVLRDQVAECDVLLAVIGPRWLTISDENGRHRLDNPDDWVRIEIVSALQAGAKKRVIPVLVGGAEMPRVEDLPADLVGLARKQAVRITLERFKSDALGLVAQVSGVLTDIETARTAKSAAERATAEASLKAQEREQAERAATAAARAEQQHLTGMSPEEVRKAEELANWEFIKAHDSIADFRDHLARFPQGTTDRYARARLEELTWGQLAVMLTTVPMSDMAAFIDEFPNSEHLFAIREEIQRRDTADAERKADKAKHAAETAAWLDVATSTDAEKLAGFLRAWPTGHYAVAAKARSGELKGGRSRRVVLSGIASGVAGTGIVAAATLLPGKPVWRMINDQSVRTFSGHSFEVNAVAIAPDGTTAISASADGTLKIWDIATGRILRTLHGHSRDVKAVAVAADGKVAVSGSFDNTVKIWDIADGREVRTLVGHSDWITSVALTTNGKTIISGEDKGLLTVWDLSTGREVRTLAGHSEQVRSIAVTLDPNFFVSASDDTSIRIWDIAAGREQRKILAAKSPILAIAITPNQRTIIAGSLHGTLTLWDRLTGRPVGDPIAGPSSIYSIYVTPDGATVVCGTYGGTLQIWEISTSRLIRTLTGHAATVNAVAVMPDGKHIISASSDRTLKLWDLNA